MSHLNHLNMSLRKLAGRAGVTTPTVYAYFESKNAILDAMFGVAAESFAQSNAEPLPGWMLTSRLSPASSAVTNWPTSPSRSIRDVIGRGTRETRYPAPTSEFGPRAASRNVARSVSVKPRATLSRVAVSAYARAHRARCR